MSKKADLKEVIVGSFTSDSEDIKTAASYSLGECLFTLLYSATVLNYRVGVDNLYCLKLIHFINIFECP